MCVNVFCYLRFVQLSFNKKCSKLKVLGSGEIKAKINISVNFISKGAKTKIEKAGGTLNILKK